MRRIVMERCLSCVVAGSIVLLTPMRVPAQAGAAGAKGIADVVHVIGLENVKRNTKGQITVQSGALQFGAKAVKADVPLASIASVDTGEETKQTGGTTATVAKMAVPYGGGRVLSLFTKGTFDIVTLEYNDGNNALHGVVLSLPKGQGAELKAQLLAQGAHPRDAAPASSRAALPPAAAAPAKGKAQKITASAIQVEPVEAGEMGLPADFRAAIYENLLDQVRKTGNFKEVYRSGDRRAASVPDLVTLRATLVKFEEGSQTKRAVTTVSGATKVEVRAVATGKDGHAMLDRQVLGQVRFFGENLRATADLAKSIAKLLGGTT